MTEMPNQKTILNIDKLSKSYSGGKISVLKNVCFGVQRGEFMVIHGESGSGKSTLLHLLAGFENADQGEIFLGGTNICRLNESGRAMFRRKNVGFVFQQFHLLPELTALENVMMPLLIRKVSMKKARGRAEHLLFYVGLEDRMNHTPEQLSGGQNQRVAVARALVGEPVVLFADEPTGSLDSKNRAELLELLKKVNAEQGTTILMVTHSAEERTIADRVIELKDGVIV